MIPTPVVVLAPISRRIFSVNVPIMPNVRPIRSVCHRSVRSSRYNSALSRGCSVACRCSGRCGYMPGLNRLPIPCRHGTSPLRVRVVSLRSRRAASRPRIVRARNCSPAIWPLPARRTSVPSCCRVVPRGRSSRPIRSIGHAPRGKTPGPRVVNRAHTIGARPRPVNRVRNARSPINIWRIVLPCTVDNRCANRRADDEHA